MFDDLHDPDPPKPGLDTLAEVAGRARRIRRRRSTSIACSSVAVVALVVTAVAWPRSSDDRMITSADTEPVPTETTPQSTETTPQSTETTPQSTETTPESTETTTVSPGAPGQDDLRLVAIDGNGDAVSIEASDGTSTRLSDGADPDDPPPAEGEFVAIDGVALSPDGSFAIVSTCCEPIPGSMSRVDLATGIETFFAYGHLPSFTASGMVVSETLGSVSVSSADGAPSTPLLEVDPSEGTIVDLAVIEVDRMDWVLAIIEGPTGTTLWKGPANGGDMSLTVDIDDATWSDESDLALAGSGEAGIYVLDRTHHGLMVFDPRSPAAVPIDQAPNNWISAWIEGGRSAFVDDQRRLFVDDVQVPGEYLWVR